MISFICTHVCTQDGLVCSPSQRAGPMASRPETEDNIWQGPASIVRQAGRASRHREEEGAEYAPGSHMVHSHTVHLPLGALMIPCTGCGTGTHYRRKTANQRNTERVADRSERARFGGWSEGQGRMERHCKFTLPPAAQPHLDRQISPYLAISRHISPYLRHISARSRIIPLTVSHRLSLAYRWMPSVLPVAHEQRRPLC